MPHPVKPKLPFVSIIVLNYNGKKWLKACFDSVRKLNYPRNKYEVIMGDNASADDSVAFVKKNYPWIKIIRFDKNYGFCKSNNDCAKQAKGEYLAFLNNDTYVDKNWLIEMVKGVLSEKDVVSVGCKMLKPYKINGKSIIDYAGGKISPDGGAIYQGLFDIDKKEYNKKKYTGFGCGAGVLVEKKFFISTGGFDEYYFAGYEEIELGLRVWQYGYKALYIPSAIMYHERIGTFGDYFNPDMLARNVRNRFYFILKNFEIKTILIFLLWAILKLFFEIFYFLLKTETKASLATLRGMLWFLRDVENKSLFRRVIVKRKEINQNKKILDKELYKKGIVSTIFEKIEYGGSCLRVVLTKEFH